MTVTPFTGESQMAHRMRAFDWNATPLGPSEGWPPSLRTAVALVLNSHYPMFVWWGYNLTFLYNDAYSPILGDRHPQALGAPAARVWAETWNTLQPLVDVVFKEGRSTWREELLWTMERKGYREERYFTFSYGPVHDESGAVGGLYCAVTEDTAKVVAKRRLRALHDLAARSTTALDSEHQASQALAAVLADYRHDVPFALLYLLDSDGTAARLAATVGVPDRVPASAACIDLTGVDEHGWPLRRVLASGLAETVTDLAHRFEPLSGGAWPEPTRVAMVLPVAHSVQDRAAGFLVAGVSPRRELDDDYRQFFGLVAGHIATALTTARACEDERRSKVLLASERQARAAAEHANRIKDDFIATLSHDLRAPLGAVLAWAQVLQRGVRDAATVREATQRIERGVETQVRLIDDLLDMSRITSGKLRIEPSDIELEDVVRAAIDTVSPSAAAKQLTIRLRSRLAGPSPLRADAVRLQQVFWNLLTNAVKFSKAGADIHVDIDGHDEAFAVSVRDSGSGIATHALPNVFDRFRQADSAGARRHGGLGLGLAIVKHVVELHGGSVRAESDGADHGATFVVTLPRRVANSENGTTPARFEEVDLAGARLLFVEDDHDTQAAILRMLTERHADVEVVATADEALQRLPVVDPDVLISDIGMPGKDGYQLIHEIRKTETGGHLPAVALTAFARPEDRDRALRAGFDRHVPKPVDPAELLVVVATLFRRAEARRLGEATSRA